METERKKNQRKDMRVEEVEKERKEEVETSREESTRKEKLTDNLLTWK